MSVIFMAGSRMTTSEGAFRVVAAAAGRSESLALEFPEIVLPFSGRKRRLQLEKMAYNLTARVSGKSALRPKNRVWGVSANDRILQLDNRLRCPELRRKSRPTPTIFTPGIPQWPSRDPIGEEGGLNGYGFLGNRPLGSVDRLGLEEIVREFVTPTEYCPPCHDTQLKIAAISKDTVEGDRLRWKFTFGVTLIGADIESTAELVENVAAELLTSP